MEMARAAESERRVSSAGIHRVPVFEQLRWQRGLAQALPRVQAQPPLC